MSHKSLEQPKREDFDGPCAVRRIGGVIVIESTQNGVTTMCETSLHNAWRIFGCLALMLEIPLSARVGKAINLSDKQGNPPKATVGHPAPRNLGERLAQNLMMQELKKRGLVDYDSSEGE